MTRRMEWNLKPYADGSGYEYTITLTVTEDGDLRIFIKNAVGEVSVDGDDWQDVSEQINDMLKFMAEDQHKAGIKP